MKSAASVARHLLRRLRAEAAGAAAVTTNARWLYGRLFEGMPRRCSEASHLGDPAANEALACAEYRDGKTILRSLPSVLTYALTTHCYTKRDICLICDRNTRPAEADSSATEAAIEAVTPLLRTARTVALHCGGEALFSPYFDRVISMIEPPTRVTFATNGMALTPKRSDLMLARDVMMEFVVSLDAASPEALRIMRPACDLETISRNVSYYVERARALERPEAKVVLNMTVCESNLDEVPKLVDLAVRLGTFCVDYNHLNEVQSHTVKMADGRDWVYAEQARFRDPDRHDRLVLEAYRKAKAQGVRMSFVGKPFIGPGKGSIDPAIAAEICGAATPVERTGAGDLWQSPAHHPLAKDLPVCTKPWNYVMIEPTGLVRSCYFHEMGFHGLGDIVKTDFMQIWNSPEMVRRREQFLARGVAWACMDSHPCVFRGRE